MLLNVLYANMSVSYSLLRGSIEPPSTGVRNQQYFFNAIKQERRVSENRFPVFFNRMDSSN
jgi:hypothetical protein